jgi:hypothetical protein
VHILLKKTDSSHIYFELKIPALSGKAADNNRQILECIAINGPMLKYGISKNVQIGRYSTVSRRVDDLTERGYLGEASKRATERGKQTEESMYGLTWRGFIASIANKTVRQNIIQVLNRQPLLSFPEKESVLVVIGEILTQQELETIAASMLKALMITIPDIEQVEDSQLLFLGLSALKELRLPKNFKLSKVPKDAWELLDRPSILEVVKEKIVPFIKQKTVEIKIMYQLASAFDGFDDFMSSLNIEEQPSKRIKEFVETRLNRLSENLPEIEKIFREE